jgi:hypothetical protein
MNILITGASGLVGTHLTRLLLQKGYAVAHLSREKGHDARLRYFTWNPMQRKMEHEALEWADLIVNLAGAPVADKRWTEMRKKELIDSRVSGLKLMAEVIRTSPKKPAALISASAIGYYGIVTNDNIYSENDPAANDFFGDCCRQWEEAAFGFEAQEIRTVILRIGIVLAKDGGALPKLAGPVKWGIGSPLGSGKQWMPWIHIDDLCAVFLKAIEENSFRGIYNAVGSVPVTNREFVRAVGKALHRPVFLPPVPAFVLKLMLGEMAGIVTEGVRVSNAKLCNSKFSFRYEKLEEALENLLS